MKTTNLKEYLQKEEYNIEKYKFLINLYPQIKISVSASGLQTFSAPEINTQYSNYDFINRRYALYFSSYDKITFSYNNPNSKFHNKTEEIIISSVPKFNKIASISRPRKINGKRISPEQFVLKFNRFSFNLKRHNFKNIDDLLDKYRSHVLKFIETNNRFKLDTKYLDPKLKKLLLLT